MSMREFGCTFEFGGAFEFGYNNSEIILSSTFNML